MTIQRSQKCRDAIRKFQDDYGKHITPKVSIWINNRIEEAFEKDEEGSQVVNFLTDLRERLEQHVRLKEYEVNAG